MLYLAKIQEFFLVKIWKLANEGKNVPWQHELYITSEQHLVPPAHPVDFQLDQTQHTMAKEKGTVKW